MPRGAAPRRDAGLSIAVLQSWSAMGSRCGTTTRCSGATPSARRRGRWPGWSAGGPAAAPAPAAAPGCGSGAGNTPSSAAMAQPSWRRWRSPASAAAASACERSPAPESRGAGRETPPWSQGPRFALWLLLNCSCTAARWRVELLHLEGWEKKKEKKKKPPHKQSKCVDREFFKNWSYTDVWIWGGLTAQLLPAVLCLPPSAAPPRAAPVSPPMCPLPGSPAPSIQPGEPGAFPSPGPGAEGPNVAEPHGPWQAGAGRASGIPWSR